ncbi:MAG: hypothetical protein ABIP51_04690 [Bacteroidia bacterium]
METTQVFAKEQHIRRNNSHAIKSIAVGISTSIVLSAYFLLIKTYALENIFYLRAANIFILLGGIVTAERLCSSRIAHKIDYLKGIRIGTQVTLLATIPYVIFMYFTIKMDPAFMSYIQNNTNFGKFLTPLPACVAGIVTIEGVVSGFILTYVFMQYFKRK